MGAEQNRNAAYDVRRQARGAQPPRKERPWLRRLVRGGIALACLIALGGTVYAWRSYTRVRTVSARVNADVRKIAPKVDAQLLELYVEVNQHVAEGEILARLDDTELQAALDAAKANTAVKESQYAQAQADHGMIGARTAADIERARAIVAVAAARVAQAQAGLGWRRIQVAEEVKRAEAQCGESRAWLTRLKKGPRDEDIKASQARLAAAKARLALCELEVKQSRELVVEGIDSQHMLEVRKTNLATQQSAVREAELELERLRAGPTEEEIDAGEQGLAARNADLGLARAGSEELERLKADLAIRMAELQEAEAQLKQAQAQEAEVLLAQKRTEAAKAELDKATAEEAGRVAPLEDRYLSAPVSGVVTRTYHKVGELCRSGVTSIMVAADGEEFWVDAFVTQKDASLIREGQRAKVRVFGRWKWLWWRRYKDARVVGVGLHTQSVDDGGSGAAGSSPAVTQETVWVKLRLLEPLADEPVRGMAARAYIRVRWPSGRR